MSAGHLTIRQAGVATVTDLGRRRGPRFGVPVGGALDQGSARLANALVGNDFGAPVLETTAANLEFVCDVDVLIAATGAPMSLLVGGVLQPMNQPVSVPAGVPVRLKFMRGGLRSYVAVHGSFEVPALLDSCAPDTVLGFGGLLQIGERIALRRSIAPIINPHYGAPLYRFDAGLAGSTVGAAGASGLVGSTAPTGAPGSSRGGALTVNVVDGPDIVDFAATADRIFETAYTVGPASNHIGLRLGDGPLPERSTSGEVLSRGVPVGAVEAPPGDELLVLHRGRGVTAGYPVLSVVTTSSLDTLAQARPGDRVAFRRVSVSHARAVARAAHQRRIELRDRVLSAFEGLGVRGLLPLARTAELGST